MITLFLTIGFFNTVWAAQLAHVDADQAEVREVPSKSGKVIEKLPKGTSVVASNIQTEGFYKVRIRSGSIGWISADILVIEPKKEEPAKNLPK